jgi:lipoyl-dependent peroxiredoxin subunit D
MMTLDQIRDAIPEHARDLRLNLTSVLTPQGAPGLDPRQIWGVALASAIAAKNPTFARQMERLAGEQLDPPMLEAARSAAAIMGMNNVYYRFLHLVDDPEYGSLPAKLRMSVIGKPGVAKADFELMSLAVSAVNGCGMCIAAHERVLRAEGFGREAIQSAVRIAAVVAAVAGTLAYATAA